MLHSLNTFLNSCLRVSCRNPKTVIGLTVFALSLISIGLFQLRIHINIADFEETAISSFQELRNLRKDFGSENSLLALFPPDVDLCNLKYWVRDRIYNEVAMESLTNPLEMRIPKHEKNTLLYPELINETCDLKNFQTYAPQSPLYKNMQNKNGYLLIDFRFKESSKGRFGSFDPIPVKQLVGDLKKTFPDVSLSGPAFFKISMLEGILKERKLNLIILLIIFILFRLLFKTWISGLLYSMTLMFCGILLYGLMGILSIPINVLNNGLFLLLAITSLEDFMYLSFVSVSGQRSFSWRESTQKLITPSFFTSLTTAIGFGSLYFSPIKVVSQFGLLVAAGAMIEWALVFLVMPGFLTYFDPRQELRIAQQSTFFSLTNKIWRPVKAKYIFRISMIVFVLGLLSLKNLSFNDDPFNFFPKTHAFVQGAMKIESAFGWRSQISLVFGKSVSSQTKDEILEKLSENNKIIDIQTSARNKAWLKQFVPSDVAPLIDIDIKGTKLEKIFIADSSERYFLFTPLSDVATLGVLSDEIRELCASNCKPISELITYSDFGRKVPQTLFESLGLSIFLVVVILIFLIPTNHRKKLTFPIIYSSVWGPISCLLLLKCFNIEVNFITCIFAAALVGLAGDNAIQFLFGMREDQLQNSILQLGGAANHIAITMIMSSLVFLFSGFEPPKTFGLLIAGGLLICYLGDIYLLQALIGKETK